MRSEFDEKPAVPLWLMATAAVTMMVHLYLIFCWVPTEAKQGIVQRLFYFHVPAATAQFAAAFLGGFYAILYLVKRDDRYDDLSLAANETVVIFGMINIGLGMLWARPIWGIWWVWDARLTSSFLLLFLYVAYLVIRPAAPVEHRAVTCAAICILGMADVPLVYMSNRLFRTQHPSPVMGGGPNSGLDPRMYFVLFFGMFTMMLLWACMLLIRRRVARLERASADLTRRAHELEDLRSY